jgi:glycosyltransferase involved in cell wall biosynthesis
VKILLFSAHFPPYGGGGEIIAGHLVAGLVERGHQVLVVTSHGALDLPDCEDFHGAMVHRFPFWHALLRGDLDAIAAGRRWLADAKRVFRPDLVHLNTISGVDIFHWRTLDAWAVPTLLTLQGPLDKPFCRPLRPDTVFDHALRRADALVACSAAALAELSEVLPSAAERCRLVYNGVPVPARAPSPPSVTPPRLLVLGRLVPGKGVDIAISAFARVRAAFPGARLVVGGDGPEQERLRRQARDLAVGDAVDFPGRVAHAEVPGLLDAASLVLMPSHVEAFGLVALEAALMQRPVVASRVGGLLEVVADGLTGLLVPSRDAGAMAEAAIALLRDEARCRRLGLAARARAQTLFTYERYVDGYEEQYSLLVRRAGRGGDEA